MNHINKIRLFILCSLIFCFGEMACRDKEAAANEIVLGWEDKQVKKILIPKQMLDEISFESVSRHLQVKLSKPGSPAILGEYNPFDKFIVFQPSIPFTRGLKYEVVSKDHKLKEFVIPSPEGKRAPVVTAIYPKEDTLPENLLKIYISFSEQMQEGVSPQHITLIKNGIDTLSNVFLDLQPELWNQDRTMLTVWLNPGRTKRDLIPNREEGTPLEAGVKYQILIKPGWHDALGDSTASAFQKNFVTVLRDTVSPDIDNWTIQPPKAGTTDPLILNLKEPLDYGVLKHALWVVNEKPNEQPGRVELSDDERTWQFIPFTAWRKGSYEIMIQSRVEDLAGNNLNRLFDTDLLAPKKKEPKQVYEKAFVIK
jgi:hypothetical protein